MPEKKLIRQFLNTSDSIIYKNSGTTKQFATGITICNQTDQERQVKFYVSTQQSLKAGAILYNTKFDPYETFVLPDKMLEPGDVIVGSADMVNSVNTTFDITG